MKRLFAALMCLGLMLLCSCGATPAKKEDTTAYNIENSCFVTMASSAKPYFNNQLLLYGQVNTLSVQGAAAYTLGDGSCGNFVAGEGGVYFSQSVAGGASALCYLNTQTGQVQQLASITQFFPYTATDGTTYQTYEQMAADALGQDLIPQIMPIACQDDMVYWYMRQGNTTSSPRLLYATNTATGQHSLVYPFAEEESDTWWANPPRLYFVGDNIYVNEMVSGTKMTTGPGVVTIFPTSAEHALKREIVGIKGDTPVYLMPSGGEYTFIDGESNTATNLKLVCDGVNLASVAYGSGSTLQYQKGAVLYSGSLLWQDYQSLADIQQALTAVPQTAKSKSVQLAAQCLNLYQSKQCTPLLCCNYGSTTINGAAFNGEYVAPNITYQTGGDPLVYSAGANSWYILQGLSANSGKKTQYTCAMWGDTLYVFYCDVSGVWQCCAINTAQIL